MIKAVSFDIGGTLVKQEREQSLLHILLKTATDIDPGLVKKYYKEHFLENKITLSHFYEKIQCKSVVKIEEIINSYYLTKPAPSLYSETIEVLRDIKNLGFFVMAISNKSYRNQACLESYGLKMYFDAEIYSHEIGCAKPDVNIFRYAQLISKVKPDEIIHIGDSIKSDILGAKEADWHTVYIHRPDNKVQNPGSKALKEPEYTITDLKQLIPILALLNVNT